jgi:hypothetical protein
LHLFLLALLEIAEHLTGQLLGIARDGLDLEPGTDL